MVYQRTQIYLASEDHRRLLKEAEEKGISLAALMREIVSAHVSERRAPYEPKTFDAITGIVDSGEPTDVARHFDEYMTEAMDQLYRKKMGLPPEPNQRKRSAKGRRKR